MAEQLVPPVNVLVDREAAERHVELLCGRRDAVCVFQVVKNPDDAFMPGNPVLVGTLGQCWETLANYSGISRRAAIYIQLNESFTVGYPERTYRRPPLLLPGTCRVFVADDDGKNPKKPEPKLAPTMILQTSANERKRHYYFRSGPHESIERFRPVQLHLALALGTDEAVAKNNAQVMRLAGTVNWKIPGKPWLVKIIEYDLTRSYSAEEMIKMHPLALGEFASAAAKAKAEPVPATEEQLQQAERVEAWLLQQRVGFRRLDLRFFLDHCPFNPMHTTALIQIVGTGAIWAGCHHDSCQSNKQRWGDFKAAIGGWGGPTTGVTRGDHAELQARMLADLGAGSPVPVVYAEGSFLRYSEMSGLYEKLGEHELTQAITTYAGRTKGRSATLTLKNSDRVGIIRWAEQMGTVPKFFENAPIGVALTNGFLAVDGGRTEFRAHAPAWRQSVAVKFAYDETATCPRFLRFLDECFAGEFDLAERVAFLQEFVGACLIGEAWRYQKAVLLTGEGSNGKSVFLDVISALFPPSMRSALKPQDLGRDYERALLVGIRLNACNEIPEAEILASDSVKSTVDGKTMIGRNPFGRPFHFQPRAGHIYNANRLPSTSDYSYAFWRRFVLLTWNRKFIEGVDDDKHLVDYLVGNELPGIFAWAIVGAGRLNHQRSYTAVPSSRAALEAWRLEVDAVAAWMHEETDPDPLPALGTPTTIAHIALREWLVANGHRGVTTQTAARRLRSYGLTARREHAQDSYPIRLRRPPVVFGV